jgi:hypothetical protein
MLNPDPAAGEGAFAVPGMPWVAAASVLLNVFLLGSVKAASWRLFAAWVAATLAFYLAYSMPASYAHHALERCGPPCPDPTSVKPCCLRSLQHAQTLHAYTPETPATCPARMYIPSDDFPANPA